MITYFSQFKAPLIAKKRKAEFLQFTQQSIRVDGAEDAHILNAFLQQAWCKMLPDSMSPFICDLIDYLFSSLLPFFFTDIHMEFFSFGKTPPKILQIVMEKSPFQSSVCARAAIVLSNELCLSGKMKLFKIPLSLKISDVILYVPLRLFIESPESNRFTNLSPITAIAFTCAEKPIILSHTFLVNGFNACKIPLIGFLWTYMLEYFFSLILCDNNCVVWDWVTNKWSLRHISRACSEFSEDLFEPFGKKIRGKDLPRFSLPDEALSRFDETRKALWERAQSVLLQPNEQLIGMSPNHGEETEPVFQFHMERSEQKDIGI